MVARLRRHVLLLPRGGGEVKADVGYGSQHRHSCELVSELAGIASRARRRSAPSAAEGMGAMASLQGAETEARK